MTQTKQAFSTIGEYIDHCPRELRERLQTLRRVIAAAAPGAKERISWGMPTFALKGNVAHFAAHKNHIGFYPGPEAIQAFERELEGYKTSKGAVQFPNDKEMPYGLVERMVRFNVERG